MSNRILEIRISNLHIHSEELHFIFSSVTRIFTFPYNEILLEIAQDCEKLPFEFYLSNMLVFQESLDLNDISKIFFLKDKTIAAEFKLNFIKKAEDCKNCKKISEVIEINKNSLITPIKGKKQNIEKMRISMFFDDKFYDVNIYIKYLENIITGVEKKLEATEIKKFQENSFEKLFQLASVIPENSKRAYQDCIQKFNQKLSEKEKSILSQKKEKEGILKNLEKEQKNFILKTRSEEKLASELNSVRNELLKLKSDSRNFESMSKLIRELQLDNESKERDIKNLRKDFKQQEENFSSLQGNFEKNNELLIDENDLLKEKIAKLELELNSMKNKFEKLNSDYINLKLQSTEENLSSRMLEKVLDNAKSESNIEVISDLNKQIITLTNKNNELLKNSKKEKDEYFKKSKFCTAQNESFQNKINKLEAHIATKLISSNDIMSTILVKQKEVISQDMQSITSQMDIINKQNTYQNTSIYENSEHLSLKLTEISQELLSNQRLINRLFNIIRECKAENMAMREKIFMAQTTLPLYLPVKGDPIDFAMAEYVNSLKNPLKIPFVREDHGIYLFGSRNIRIKLQNNKLIVCFNDCVIEVVEFVAKNTKQELEKFEQNRKNSEILNLSMISKKSNTTINEETFIYPGSPLLNGNSGGSSVAHKSSRNTSFDFPLRTTDASFGSGNNSPAGGLRKYSTGVDGKPLLKLFKAGK